MGWGRTSSPSGLFKEYLVVITPQTALWSARAVRPGACRPRCVRPFTGSARARCPAQHGPKVSVWFVRLPLYMVLNKYTPSAAWSLIPAPQSNVCGRKDYNVGAFDASVNVQSGHKQTLLNSLHCWICCTVIFPCDNKSSSQSVLSAPWRAPLCSMPSFRKESVCSPLLTLLRAKTSPENGSDKTPEGVPPVLSFAFISLTAALGHDRELILSHGLTGDRLPSSQLLHVFF